MTDGPNDEGARPVNDPVIGERAVIDRPAIDPVPPGAFDGAPRRRRARLVGLLTGGIILLLVLVALLLSSPFWAPSLAALLPWGPGPEQAQRVDALAAQVAADKTAQQAATQQQAQLGQRIDRLQQQLKAAAASAAAPAAAEAALGTRVAALEQQLKAATSADTAAVAPLKGGIDALGSRVDALTARLGQVAARAASGDSQTRSLLLAVEMLRADLASSRPYASDLETIEALGRGDPAVAAVVAPLTAGAASGLPSTALLARRFTETTAPAILRAAASGATAPKDWLAAIVARLRSLVIVRRLDGAGTPSGDPAAAGVAQAQTALDKGDLAGAVAALKPLSGPAAQTAASWLAAAQQRLAAETALARLTRQIAAQLAPASSPAAPASAAPAPAAPAAPAPAH